MKINKFFILLLIILAGYSCVNAYSNSDEVNRIADKLRCPTCQGLSVKESQSGLSVNMKEKIDDLLEQGKSEQQILTFFEKRYGEWILRSPKKEGFNLLLWVLPFLFFFVFGGSLVFVLKTQKHKKINASAGKSNEVDVDDFEKLKSEYLES